MVKSLQSKQYMVSSLARVRVCMQHIERGVSEAGAGLQILASLRPALAGGGGRGRCEQAGAARRGGVVGVANLGSEEGAARRALLRVARRGSEEGS